MGISAISVVSGLQKDDIIKLRTSFQACAERSGGNKDVSREDFEQSVKGLESIDVADVELLDKLFILLDESGESKVDIKDFLTAASLLVNSGSIGDKLQFAFSIFDDAEAGTIFAQDCIKVLSTINATASFFGDPVLATGEIRELVDAIWLECSIPSAPLQYPNHINFILNHEIAQRFTSGKGTVRFES